MMFLDLTMNLYVSPGVKPVTISVLDDKPLYQIVNDELDYSA
jgi:hypothetical protein